MRRYIIRLRKGKKFQYILDGISVNQKSHLTRIKSLAIPPAWQEVKIAVSARAKVQATGRDKAGRKQILYSVKFRAQQEKAKFERIEEFAKHLPPLRRQIDKDISRKKLTKNKVVACIIKLMDEAYFRVGNSVYAKTHQTYGITTIRSKHAKIAKIM